MRTVRIIFGTYGYHDGYSIDAKTRNSEPFELDDAEAERIVSLGVAEYTDEANDIAVATPASDNNAHEYSVNSSVSDLRALAKSVGITFKIGTTKEDMVAALDEYFKNDEDMPDMSAADPE